MYIPNTIPLCSDIATRTLNSDSLSYSVPVTHCSIEYCLVVSLLVLQPIISLNLVSDVEPLGYLISWLRTIKLKVLVHSTEYRYVNHSTSPESLSQQSTNFPLCTGRPIPLFIGSGYFASRGKIAPCYFAIWRQNSPNGYFAASAKIALSLMLTQTLTHTQTLILTLIPTLALTLTQTEEKHILPLEAK